MILFDRYDVTKKMKVKMYTYIFVTTTFFTVLFFGGSFIATLIVFYDFGNVWKRAIKSLIFHVKFDFLD